MRICAECFKAQDWVEHVKAYGAPGRCAAGVSARRAARVSDRAAPAGVRKGLYRAPL